MPTTVMSFILRRPFGLAAYVFTENINEAVYISEALEYGIISLNDGSPSAVQAPFGGFKESGLELLRKWDMQLHFLPPRRLASLQDKQLLSTEDRACLNLLLEVFRRFESSRPH